jgi:hypothetical protein
MLDDKIWKRNMDLEKQKNQGKKKLLHSSVL